MNSFKKIILLLSIAVTSVCISQVKKKSDYLQYNAKILDSTKRAELLSELKNEIKSVEDKYYFKLAEGAVLNVEDKLTEAVAAHYEAISISEELKSDSLKGVAFARLGTVYFFRERLDKALLNMNEALKFLPENKTDSIYVNLLAKKLMLFSYLDLYSEYKPLIKWLLSAATIQQSKILESNLYNTIGTCFLDIKEPDTAIYYFRRSLEIRERIKNAPWIGQSYNNIGTAYFIKSDFQSALKYFQLGCAWRIKGKAAFGGVIESYVNIGKAYFKIKNISLANSYLNKAFLMADSVGSLSIKQRAAIVLKDIFLQKGDFKKAMEYQDVYYAINDSLYSAKKKEELSNMTLDFETDQKLKQDSLKRVQAEFTVKFERDKQEAVSKRTTIIIGLLVLFLSVVAFFAFTFFKSNKQKQKQNEIITKQHSQLQEKQIEINDSINYAKNIQNALLPSKTLFKEKCKEFFVYFEPKDVVSGDFYWAASIKDAKKDLFVFITADCTGHGVPGAFMSLISISFFNEIINEEKILEPAEILNTLRRKLIQTFSHKESSHRQDGLDCLVCVINNKTKELSYSGANNRLYHGHYDKGYTITEYRTDKMPVGKSPHEHIPFTNNVIQLNDNDIIYTFTDGYSDQFGGTANKKLKTKNVQKKIESIANKPLVEQELEIKCFFENWKGDNEQIDDVTFIAIKI